MSVESVESLIAEWRAYLAGAAGVNGRDVDELEDHLRDQIAELNAVGLAPDEAFLVAVKRMGDLDALSREFAREHSGRLWKQLVLSGEDEPANTITYAAKTRASGKPSRTNVRRAGRVSSTMKMIAESPRPM